MATSGNCYSTVASGVTAQGNSYSGAQYRWEWSTKVISPGHTQLDWYLYGEGRTTSPTYLKNSCKITVGNDTIYSLDWGEDQNLSTGKNTTFNANDSNSCRGYGFFTIAHSDDQPINLSIKITAAFYAGASTATSKTTIITINANPPSTSSSYYTLSVTREPSTISGVEISGYSNATTASVKGGQSVTVEASPHTPGYHFKHWQGYISGSQIQSTHPTYTFPMPTQDLTLTAYGEKNLLTIDPKGGSMVSYYDHNSGQTTTTTESFQIQFAAEKYRLLGQFYNSGWSSTTSICGAPVRYGYDFTGWHVSGSGTVTLQSSATGPLAVMNDDHLRDSDLERPSDAQYYTYYNSQDTNSKIIAQWDPHINTLTVNPNGGTMRWGSNTVSTQRTVQFKYGRNVYMGILNDDGTYFAPNAPTRTGYRFNGYTFSYGTGGLNTNAQEFYFGTNDSGYGTTTDTWIFHGDYDGNVTATAQWTANTYTVKFNGNGSTSGSMNNQSHTYGTYKTLTSNTFTKTGYHFSHWNTEPDGTGTSYNDAENVRNLTSTNGKTINLYAQWDINYYQCIVSHDETTIANTGMYPVSSSTWFPYATNFTITATPKGGYAFKAWQNPNTGEQISNNNPYTFSLPDHDVIIHAIGELNGFIWIYVEQSDGTKEWQKAIPYIYTGSADGWKPTSPYIYSNGDWTICGE